MIEEIVQFVVVEAFVIGGRYSCLLVHAIPEDWRIKFGSFIQFELNGKQRRVRIVSADIPRFADGSTDKIGLLISERELRKAELHRMIGVRLTLEEQDSA